MNINSLNESKLTEILKIAQDGETKFKEMSDRATIMAEKWKVITHTIEKHRKKRQANIALEKPE